VSIPDAQRSRPARARQTLPPPPAPHAVQIYILTTSRTLQDDTTVLWQRRREIIGCTAGEGVRPHLRLLRVENTPIFRRCVGSVTHDWWPVPFTGNIVVCVGLRLSNADASYHSLRGGALGPRRSRRGDSAFTPHSLHVRLPNSRIINSSCLLVGASSMRPGLRRSSAHLRCARV